MIAVPAAQAALPPIKAFPKVFFNGTKATAVHKPAIISGSITLENTIIGAMSCNSAWTGQAFNETTEGTEKGFLNTVGYMTYGCEAGNKCTVKNTRGEEVEGIYLTAEAPPVVKGTEVHNAGITSLPWTGEFIERETEKRQVLTHHLKLWLVLPPGAPIGQGIGCAGTELEFEEEEGPTEKEAGYELAWSCINGTRNGLKPTHCEFRGEEGLTEKGFPVTGRLHSPQVGDGILTASKLIHAGLEGNWELVTAQ
jgi:hypothetical protein